MGSVKRKSGDGNILDKRKKLRTAGREYVTSKNKIVSAKQLPLTEDTCKCRCQCSSVSIDRRLKLFNEFYAMKDYASQTTYLLNMFHSVCIKRRRHGTYDSPDQSRRQCTFKYTLPNDKGEIIHVCKQTFSKVFAITPKRLQILNNKKKNGLLVCTENRGNKTQFRKCAKITEKSVINNLNSIKDSIALSDGTILDIRKKLRTAGQEYTTSKNKTVPAKQLPLAEDTCKCSYQCSSISLDRRLELFSELYAMKDYASQTTYLLNMFHSVCIKRRRHGTYDSPDQSRRQCTFEYTLPNDKGEKVRVCKQTFSKVFAITPKRLQILNNKKKSGLSVCTENIGNKTQFRKYIKVTEKSVGNRINSTTIK